jgi:hypothetical protein
MYILTLRGLALKHHCGEVAIEQSVRGAHTGFYYKHRSFDPHGINRFVQLAVSATNDLDVDNADSVQTLGLRQVLYISELIFCCGNMEAELMSKRVCC